MSVRRFPSATLPILPLAATLLMPQLALGQPHFYEIGSDSKEAIPAITPTLWEGVPAAVKERSNWAFELGFGVISDNTPNDYLLGSFDPFEGAGEGYTYNFTVSYQIHEFDWQMGGCRFQPTLELPFMLTLVDEDGGDIIPDVNFGALFRWRDFPWNHHVYTTFGLGGGMSYAFDDWQADIERHNGDDRSQLKFWLSLEFTFAAPSHPEHQLVFFADHQSGAHLFDEGGIDAWGIGYRHLF